MAATKTKRWRIDFLEARPDAPADALALQLREARNVVSSYSHGVDFLAEALQNAADAIDTRRQRTPTEDRAAVPARIHIVFDCLRRRFSVTDTGIGMSRQDLDLVLTPNVTLKSGREARAGTRARAAIRAWACLSWLSRPTTSSYARVMGAHDSM